MKTNVRFFPEKPSLRVANPSTGLPRLLPWGGCHGALWFHAVLLLALGAGPAAGNEEWAREARELARPLERVEDLHPVLAEAAEARLVLLGESTHGTHEFYAWRDRISRHLIEKHGFSFIAVEGDWAALQRVDAFVRQAEGAPSNAREALAALDRWPVWMWSNREIAGLIEWLRNHNEALPFEERVGFHGMDVYDPWRSMEELIAYFDSIGEEAGEKARRLFREWARYAGDGQRYARAVYSFFPSAEEDLAQIVEKLFQHAPETLPTRDPVWFPAKQNAMVVKNAERHFRKMTRQGPDSWNARAQHMHETVVRLLDHYGDGAKGIVWAHNTHVGDARATGMAAAGQVNIGQLARQRFGREKVFSIGFGAGGGTVVAGRGWGAPAEIMKIPDPVEGSVEEMLNRIGWDGLWMRLSEAARGSALFRPKGHRAVGVVYQPERDPLANYVTTVLPDRYDAFIFFRSSRALDPL